MNIDMFEKLPHTCAPGVDLEGSLYGRFRDLFGMVRGNYSSMGRTKADRWRRALESSRGKRCVETSPAVGVSAPLMLSGMISGVSATLFDRCCPCCSLVPCCSVSVICRLTPACSGCCRISGTCTMSSWVDSCCAAICCLTAFFVSTGRPATVCDGFVSSLSHGRSQSVIM